MPYDTMSFLLLDPRLFPLHTLSAQSFYSIHHVYPHVVWDSLTLCILSRRIRIVQIYFSTLLFYASVTKGTWATLLTSMLFS